LFWLLPQTMKAYAKINLGLHILRKRADGYHDIETVFHRINIADDITFEHHSEIMIDCSHPDVPRDQTNLCWKSADALRKAVGETRGVKIIIEKRIPVSAGLGGGSADAGLVLRALPKFLGIAINNQTVFDIALALGSDIPYFLSEGTARATGRGEMLEYFDLRLPYWIVVVYPNICISTAWAYQQVELNPFLKYFDLRELLVEHLNNPNVWVNKLRNDFEPAVFRHYEDVMRIKEILIRTGADYASLSGSGSAVFGLFRDEGYARDTYDFFKVKYPVFLTEPNFQPTK
jgi:4-diphosphocytidyl-2-C-methyl-D-erythritol kinase